MPRGRAPLSIQLEIDQREGEAEKRRGHLPESIGSQLPYSAPESTTQRKPPASTSASTTMRARGVDSFISRGQERATTDKQQLQYKENKENKENKERETQLSQTVRNPAHASLSQREFAGCSLLVAKAFLLAIESELGKAQFQRQHRPIANGSCRCSCFPGRPATDTPIQFRNNYDGDTVTFSPTGRIFQVEYALEAIKQGSAVVGLATNDCVVLAALKVSLKHENRGDLDLRGSHGLTTHNREMLRNCPRTRRRSSRSTTTWA